MRGRENTQPRQAPNGCTARPGPGQSAACKSIRSPTWAEGTHAWALVQCLPARISRSWVGSRAAGTRASTPTELAHAAASWAAHNAHTKLISEKVSLWCQNHLLEEWFKSQLLHCWSSSQVTGLGKQQVRAADDGQVPGTPDTHMGDLKGAPCSWRGAGHPWPLRAFGE